MKKSIKDVAKVTLNDEKEENPEPEEEQEDKPETDKKGKSKKEKKKKKSYKKGDKKKTLNLEALKAEKDKKLTLFEVYTKFMRTMQEGIEIKGMDSVVDLLDSDSDVDVNSEQSEAEEAEHPEERIVYCKRGHICYNRKTIARDLDE